MGNKPPTMQSLAADVETARLALEEARQAHEKARESYKWAYRYWEDAAMEASGVDMEQFRGRRDCCTVLD